MRKLVIDEIESIPEIPLISLSRIDWNFEDNHGIHSRKVLDINRSQRSGFSALYHDKYRDMIGHLSFRRCSFIQTLVRDLRRLFLARFLCQASYFCIKFFSLLFAVMAYFEKMIALVQDKRRMEPIKLPTFDNSAILEMFDWTLVRRVLNMEAQGHIIKELIGFLPSVWMCEERVQGVEMGKGKFHFHFTDEADLKDVLSKRPYHFDQYMTSLERWVPSIRSDFPATIPFWVTIEDLPEHYFVAALIKAIGEKLGELVDWEVEL